MRKRFFRFLKIGLCCFPLYLQAQEIPAEEEVREEDHTSFIAMRLGANIGGKGFNSNDVISPQVGSFLSYALEGAWLPHRNIGLMLSLQQHRFNGRSPEPFSRPGYVVGQSNDPWITNQILGGVYLSKPFLYVDLEGRFLLGPGNTSAFVKHYERQKSPLYEQYISYSGTSLWYQAGLTLRMDKNSGWSVAFNYDFNFADHSYRSREVYGGSLNGEVVYGNNTALSFSVFSFSVLYAVPHYK